VLIKRLHVTHKTRIARVVELDNNNQGSKKLFFFSNVTITYKQIEDG